MSTEATESQKYPIGKYAPPASFTQEQMNEWIAEFKALPGKLRTAVMGLDETQLETPYRPGGWTIRQTVHHVADSHMNALIRFKWALTEDNPTIKPYEEKDWAVLADSKLPLEPSLKIIEGVHARLVALFESMSEEQWSRTFIHPESGATILLKRNLGLYAWHGNHHLAHITNTQF